MAAIADHPISDLYFDETNSTVSPIFLPTTRGKSPFFLRRNRAKSSSPNLFLVLCWIGFVSKQIDSKFGSGYHVVRHEIEILLQFFISFFLIYYLVYPFFYPLCLSTDLNPNSRQWEREWNFEFDIRTCSYFVGEHFVSKEISIFFVNRIIMDISLRISQRELFLYKQFLYGHILNIYLCA